LDFSLFISKRILKKDKDNFSRPIIRISVISIALGVAVMIISIAVVLGFKSAIRDKVVGFGSHIQITQFEISQSFETAPISRNQSFLGNLKAMPGIRHIQVFGLKSGLIKTEEDIQGVVFKGIEKDFNWDFFEPKIQQGRKLVLNDTVVSNEILISQSLASLLKFKLGDDVRMYFIVEGEMQPRGRKFQIKGIYNTGLEEFDKIYVIGDIRHIRKLNGWGDDQVAGFEILIDDFDRIEEMRAAVNTELPYDLKATTITDINPQIFDWLNLQDMNVAIIIILMVLVSIISMISTLLILVLEKTNMIGILKALGSSNPAIRRIFMIQAGFIILKGLFWGNFIGLALALLQLQTGWFRLDETSYYVSRVPVQLDIWSVLLINAGTFLICLTVLIIPAIVISRISPIRAIRWE